MISALLSYGLETISLEETLATSWECKLAMSGRQRSSEADE